MKGLPFCRRYQDNKKHKRIIAREGRAIIAFTICALIADFLLEKQLMPLAI